jgi:excisionase family DNA binding protein
MSRQSATKEVAAASLPEEIWNLTEVMRFLKVSRTAIYDLMKNDGLPYIQIGKYRKFDPRDIAAWWERKRRQQQIA